MFVFYGEFNMGSDYCQNETYVYRKSCGHWKNNGVKTGTDEQSTSFINIFF